MEPSANDVFEVILEIWKEVHLKLPTAKSMIVERPTEALVVARKITIVLKKIKDVLYNTKNDLTDSQRALLASIESKAQRFSKLLPDIEQ